MANICFSGVAVADFAPAAPSPALALAAPVHCGVPMEWTTPGAAFMTVYSLAPADAGAELPPLWRCACGFQLDGIVQPSNFSSGHSR